MVKLEDAKTYISNHSRIAIFVPTILCCIQFLTDIYEMFYLHDFSYAMFCSLLSSANGFETVILFVIMLMMKDKKS